LVVTGEINQPSDGGEKIKKGISTGEKGNGGGRNGRTDYIQRREGRRAEHGVITERKKITPQNCAPPKFVWSEKEKSGGGVVDISCSPESPEAMRK